MVARLGLSKHTVTIERRVGGKWSNLASNGQVKPEEAIRYSAHYGVGWTSHQKQTTFTVVDENEQIVWGPGTYNTNFAGNSWVDANAPVHPGSYTVIGESEGALPGSWGLIGSGGHALERTFRVSESAPEPAHVDSPNGFSFGDILPEGGPFGSAWIWVLLLAGILMVGVVI